MYTDVSGTWSTGSTAVCEGEEGDCYHGTDLSTRRPAARVEWTIGEVGTAATVNGRDARPVDTESAWMTVQVAIGRLTAASPPLGEPASDGLQLHVPSPCPAARGDVCRACRDRRPADVCRKHRRLCPGPQPDQHRREVELRAPAARGAHLSALSRTCLRSQFRLQGSC